MSSFISGIETDVSNFFSGASDAVNGVVNFGSNVMSSIHQAVQGVINGLASIGQGLINGITTFGSDIINAFSNTAFAIWHGLVSFASIVGGFFQTAMHTIASAIYGAFNKIHDALIDAWRSITNAVNALATTFVNLFNDFKADLFKLAGFFWDVYNDLKPIFASIWNAFVTGVSDFISALANIPNDIVNFFNTLINDITGFANDIMYFPEDASKYVASKISTIMPRLVDFNVFMETIKQADKVASNMAIKSPKSAILYKLASPFIGLLAGAIANSVVSSGYKEFSGVTQGSRKSIQTSQVENPFTGYTLSPPFSQINTNTLSKPSPSTTSPTSAQYASHYIVGAREDDVLSLDNNVTIYNKLISPYPNSQTGVDQLNISGSIVQITRSTTSKKYSFTYSISTFFET